MLLTESMYFNEQVRLLKFADNALMEDHKQRGCIMQISDGKRLFSYSNRMNFTRISRIYGHIENSKHGNDHECDAGATRTPKP